MKEISELVGGFLEVQASLEKDAQLKDVRNARLKIALQLMKQGESPESAMNHSKDLVVILFAAQGQDK